MRKHRVFFTIFAFFLISAAGLAGATAPSSNLIEIASPTLAPTPAPTAAPTPDPAVFEALRAFVETELLPMPGGVADESALSGEEREQIILAAERAGLTFSGDWRSSLLAENNHDRIYDFLTRLAQSQLGDWLLWSQEQRAWLNRANASLGADSGDLYPLPGPDELSQQDAAALAQKALTERYGLAASDFERYTLSACLTRGAAGGDKRPAYWLVELFPNGRLVSPEYSVAFPASRVAGRVFPVRHGVDLLSDYLAGLEREHGAYESWPREQKDALLMDWPMLRAAYGDDEGDTRTILRIDQDARQ